MTKRCRFLTEVVTDLGLPATVHNARAETLTLAVDIVTARACAPLHRLFGYARSYLAMGAQGLFLKGQDVVSDMTEAAGYWEYEADVVPSLSDPGGRIVRVKRLGPTPFWLATTTAINLGTALAAVGEKVLLIDSDPQGNASTGLGVGRAQRRNTLYDVLMGEKPVIEALVTTTVPGLDLVPSDPDLSGVELELGQHARRSFKLRVAPAAQRGVDRVVLQVQGFLRGIHQCQAAAVGGLRTAEQRKPRGVPPPLGGPAFCHQLAQ
eukprot:gene416-596_t